jgi:hypothetical protein
VTRGSGISHEKYKEVKSFAGTLKSKRIKILLLGTSDGKEPGPMLHANHIHLLIWVALTEEFDSSEC